jgi:6-phosphogluconolactonase (cycloisomerase 2 family)
MDRIALFSVFSMIWMLLAGCRTSEKNDLTMIVGAYTSGNSEGIYVYRLNMEKLTATLLSKTVADNPSCLAIAPDAKLVYAVNESGEANSAVSAFAFDKKSGTLIFLNRQKVRADPCYILLTNDRRGVITANYSGGSISVVPIAGDGRLVAAENVLQFYGSGTDTVRQTKPHLHCVVAGPDHTTFFAADLGTDRIYRIKLNPDLTPAQDPDEKEINSFREDNGSVIHLEGHSGPRHLIFNRKGTNAYLINELSGKVTVFSVDMGQRLQEIQSVVADTCYAEGSADIHLSPDEKFLYTSTRLKGDGIVIFKVNPEGTVEKAGYQATRKHPRNFAITPDGNLMLVACKDSDMIQIFRIDKQTGMLTDTGRNISIARPVCIKFAP